MTEATAKTVESSVPFYDQRGEVCQTRLLDCFDTDLNWSTQDKHEQVFK